MAVGRSGKLTVAKDCIPEGMEEIASPWACWVECVPTQRMPELISSKQARKKGPTLPGLAEGEVGSLQDFSSVSSVLSMSQIPLSDIILF